MKKLTKDLRIKTAKELTLRENALRQEIGKLTVEFKTNPPKNTNQLFRKRKELAVVLTILQEKKDLEELKK